MCPVFSSDPRLFEHPSLFRSCHFFGPHKFAAIVKMINESSRTEQCRTRARCSERELGCSAATSSLKADLQAVLRSHVGKQVAARRPAGSVGGPHSSHITGTVVNSFIEKNVSYLVIEWHITASKTIIALRQFMQSGQFRVLGGSSAQHASSPSSLAARLSPSSARNKHRGAMKYA